MYGFGFESFYFYFFVIYVLYALIVDGIFRNNKKSEVFILFLPLLILAMFRGEYVGGDLERYLPTFDYVCNSSSVLKVMAYSRFEPGFLFLNKIISYLSSSHRAFIIVTSLLSLVGPWFVIYKYSKMPVLSILLYFSLGFYTNTFNNVRQGIAMSICMLSVYFLFERKFIKFLFVVIVAGTIHYSALFFPILYVLTQKRLKTIHLLCILGAGISVFAVAKNTIISTITSSIFYRYSNTDFESSGGWGLMIMYSLLFSFELLMYLYLHKGLNERQKQLFYFFLVTQMLSVIIQPYATIWSSMTRVTQYFYNFIIIAIPFMIALVPKWKYIAVSVVLIVSVIFMTKFVYAYNPLVNSNGQGVIPYTFLDYKFW